MSLILSKLSDNADAIALVDSNGVEVSYRGLLRRADDYLSLLAGTRKLVFLEVENNTESIAAYLACLVGSHPVYLFSKQDADLTRKLAARYRPNIIIRPTQGISESWCDDHHHLHPDLSVLLSTSGSTGSPKFVKLSERNIVENAKSIADYLEIGRSERAITSLGFNYSYGMSVVNSHLFAGASILLSTASAADSGFWKNFELGGATSFAGVPYIFDLLERSGLPWYEARGLRYVTQAGGGLSSSLVRKFSALGRENGWRFYVMYGQTEASPRISYLPPHLAEQYPNCIGIPIPRGELSIVDDNGEVITEIDVAGQLAYRGPNVMMGYAESALELDNDETPAQLLTGDIACVNAAGLYYIVGRSNRFVKPFGLRVNLDDLQRQLQVSYPGALCAGNDESILVALSDRNVTDLEIVEKLTSIVKLPTFVFKVIRIQDTPRLSNGKVDYQSILSLGCVSPKVSSGGWLPMFGVWFTSGFVKQAAIEAGRLVGLVEPQWSSVESIFSTILNAPSVKEFETFASLEGDSMSYVQMTIALEEYIGHLPRDWENLSIADLERERAIGGGY